MVADAIPYREGCPLAADVVHSTHAAHWPSRCWVDCPRTRQTAGNETGAT